MKERIGEVYSEKEAVMNSLEAVLVVVSLFAVRFAVPLALTVGVAAGMNRLLERWVPEI